MSKAKFYIGNKAIPGVFQKIINEIPLHDYYVEGFAGSGAIGRLLPAGTAKHFNDLNTDILQRINVKAGGTVIKSSLDILDLLQLISVRSGNPFAFLDPPYLLKSRNYRQLYEHEMSVVDHSNFLAAVQKLNFNCMIIHPQCEMYDHALQSWRSVQIKIRYNRKTSIEKLYMNYSRPSILQTSKYLGNDCWDRQRIKRKAARFLTKGMHLPFPEPTYIQDIFNNESTDSL